MLDISNSKTGAADRSGSACPSYLALVPAYNEGAAVANVIVALRERAPDFDVLVVDDGSTDDTSVQARRAGARVLRLPFNLGIGGAVQAGFQFAAVTLGSSASGPALSAT